MRAYFFTNFYLSSLQNGIQVAHCLAELASEYGTDLKSDYSVWAAKHKTIIVLNGGNSSDLASKAKTLQEFDFKNKQTPEFNNWSLFYESTDALSGALTCVGVIINDTVYDLAAEIRGLSVDDRHVEYISKNLSPREISLCELIIPCRLAS